MFKCGLPDNPVQTDYVIGKKRWSGWCKCGYGVQSDNPEDVVIALAHHLEATSASP